MFVETKKNEPGNKLNITRIKVSFLIKLQVKELRNYNVNFTQYNGEDIMQMSNFSPVST
jgi:hypothetical protein